MKTRIFMQQWAMIVLMLSNVFGVFAQSEAQGFAREQRIYDLFVSGQGDSLHVALCADFQAQFPPAVLGGLYKQLEMQFGTLQSTEAWQEGNVQGITVYYRDMQFERMKLRFMLAFDAEGKVNSMTVTPAPAATSALPSLYNREKMEERDITVTTDSFRLPGTLALPKAAFTGSRGKVPCVVFVHGSGPQDRDETIGPNKPFRDLAWGLAERGIATLRYDKRTKVYGAASVPAREELNYDTETVNDALSAIALAQTLPEISADSIYLLGHSLGGMLAPRIAEQQQRSAHPLAGIILLAAPARPTADLLAEQLSYLSSLPGTTATVRQQSEEAIRQALNLKKLGTDAFDSHIPLPLGLPHSYWLFDIKYKPLEVAAKLKLPLLVLQGERDYQVTMEDFVLWRQQLQHHKNASFKSYPQLNHLLQVGSGKATPMEYNQASPVPTYVMEDIVRFIRR